MSKNKLKQIGKLAPRYTFALNPYKDTRVSKCPTCSRLTNARKFPLLILVDGWGPFSLGKTCRYCPRCEFIIAHQDSVFQGPLQGPLITAYLQFGSHQMR